ncbi:MAG: hypothetical protein KF819_14075 [Labilithrix sp.]|nr:hypothetical protein [Labilithrix sp.]
MRLVACLACVCVGCVHDVVLPSAEVTAVCGNGVVEPGEACDVESPGCVACAVVPTWSCTTEQCTSTCGDGVVSTDADCRAPRREVDGCDMSGYWAARETTYLRETILGGIQTSSHWFFLRLVQEGESFRFAEEIDCGLLVTGSATVRYAPAARRAVIYSNRMDGGGDRPARRGVSRKADGGCSVSFDRWYAVRGADPALLPPDFNARPALATLPPLPAVRDPLAAGENPEGAVDPDADGNPGLGFQISGIASGVRSAAQRDWKEWTTPAGASVPAAAMTVVVPGAFDLEENVLRVLDCGLSCGLLTTPARVAQDLTARITLGFVGRSIDGPRVAQVASAIPRTDLDADLATCANVRLLLPHDASPP